MAPAPALPEEFLDAAGAFEGWFLFILTRVVMVVVMMAVFAPAFSVVVQRQHPEKSDKSDRDNDAQHDQNVPSIRATTGLGLRVICPCSYKINNNQTSLAAPSPTCMSSRCIR